MKKALPYSVVLLLICMAAVSSPKVAGQTTTSTVTRNPQALALLNQALNVAGGTSAVSMIQDFTATGNVTYYWDEPVQGTVTVRGRGLHEFRVDAALPDGAHSWVVSSASSFQKNPNGTTSALPSQSTVKTPSATIPAIQLLAVIQDTSYSITDGGLVTHDGQQEHEVIVQKTFPLGSDPMDALSAITKTEFFIDPNALTVQSIDDTAYPINDAPGSYPHEMQFSAYQTTNGVLVPFTITELIAGQQTETIQLTQINFNTGLTDADFE